MTITSRTSFRLDDETLAKLDADRGKVNRTEYIRRLIAAVPPLTVKLAGEPASTPPAPKARPARSRSKGTAPKPRGKPGTVSCLHPVTRRIGSACGLCGQPAKKA